MATHRVFELKRAASLVRVQSSRMTSAASGRLAIALVVTVILCTPCHVHSLNINRENYKVHRLEGSATVSGHSDSSPSSILDIYCYMAKPRNAKYTFRSVYFHPRVKDDDYNLYEGPTPASVRQAYDDDNSFWSFSMLWNNRPNDKSVDPFEKTCVAIKTNGRYELHLEDIEVDDKRVALFIIGMSIFMFSKILGENSLFFYIIGILLGVCMSFMILVYFMSKLLPGKPFVYGTMIGGWTVGIYALQFLWNNFKQLMIVYHEYFVWYVLITGFISFVICYKMGPPRKQRSKNLVIWTLQFVGIIGMYFSTYLWESVIVATIGLMFLKYFPFMKIFGVFSGLKIFKRTPVRRLLTNEEFERQASIETAKALEELRGYCSSPECPSWKIIRRLKDPKRFANFIDGEDHLSDGEVSEHEAMLEYSIRRKNLSKISQNGRAPQNPELTSDDSSSEDDK